MQAEATENGQETVEETCGNDEEWENRDQYSTFWQASDAS